MGRYLFSIRRILRRAGITLAVFIVLLGMLLEWASHRASDIVRALVRLTGLTRVEDWLRRRSMWFALLLIVPTIILSALFKIYEINLVRHHQFLRAISYGLIFKVVGVGIMNYLLHLYSERLLQVRWIARWYGSYTYICSIVLEYLKQISVYQYALRIKRHIVSLARHRSVLATAQRFARIKKYR